MKTLKYLIALLLIPLHAHAACEFVEFDANSNIIRAKIIDTTDNQGLTGLAHDTASLRISTIANNEETAVSYTSAGSTIETVTTIGTYSAPTATKVRFRVVDATNHPGLYEFQLADARFSVADAKSLILSASGAANMQEMDCFIPLLDVNPDVNVASVSGDTTAADNAELFFDGTGYAGGTTKLNVNTFSITGNAITSASIASNAIGNTDIDSAVYTDVIGQLLSTTVAELSSIPNMATPTVGNILRWVFQYGVGAYAQETTATERTLYKNDGTTVLAECTVDDDATTFTRGECAAP